MVRSIACRWCADRTESLPLVLAALLALNGCATIGEEPSGGAIALDVFAKLVGGIACGMSEPAGGNSAMAVSVNVSAVSLYGDDGTYLGNLTLLSIF